MFEPGFTYRTTGGLAFDAITFHCHAIAERPGTDEQIALGFTQVGFNRAEPAGLTRHDWQYRTWRIVSAPTSLD